MSFQEKQNKPFAITKPKLNPSNKKKNPMILHDYNKDLINAVKNAEISKHPEMKENIQKCDKIIRITTTLSEIENELRKYNPKYTIGKDCVYHLTELLKDDNKYKKYLPLEATDLLWRHIAFLDSFISEQKSYFLINDEIKTKFQIDETKRKNIKDYFHQLILDIIDSNDVERYFSFNSNYSCFIINIPIKTTKIKDEKSDQTNEQEVSSPDQNEKQNEPTLDGFIFSASQFAGTSSNPISFMMFSATSDKKYPYRLTNTFAIRIRYDFDHFCFNFEEIYPSNEEKHITEHIKCYNLTSLDYDPTIYPDIFKLGLCFVIIKKRRKHADSTAIILEDLYKDVKTDPKKYDLSFTLSEAILEKFSNIVLNNKNEIESLKKTTSELNEKLTKANEQLTKANEQLKNEINEQLKNEINEIKEENQKHTKANEQLAKANEQLTKANEQLAKANEQLRNENEEFKKYIQQIVTDIRTQKQVNEQLKTDNEQLKTDNEQLRKEKEQLIKDKEPIKETM